MELTNYLIDTAMAMKQTQFQQGVEMAMMKKTMQASTDMIKGVLDMADSVPIFPGDNGNYLNVRA